MEKDPIPREESVEAHKRARAMAQGLREVCACRKRWFPDKVNAQPRGPCPEMAVRREGTRKLGPRGAVATRRFPGEQATSTRMTNGDLKEPREYQVSHLRPRPKPTEAKSRGCRQQKLSYTKENVYSYSENSSPEWLKGRGWAGVIIQVCILVTPFTSYCQRSLLTSLHPQFPHLSTSHSW